MSSLPPCAMLKHVHHSAYRCRDAEQTRWFYEEVLGLPLTLAMVFDEEPGTGRKIDYMHLFFKMGDDNFIAFFDAPDDADEKMFRPRSAFDLHLAFEVDTREELKDWRRRINKGRSSLLRGHRPRIYSLPFISSSPRGIHWKSHQGCQVRGGGGENAGNAHGVLKDGRKDPCVKEGFGCGPGFGWLT